MNLNLQIENDLKSGKLTPAGAALMRTTMTKEQEEKIEDDANEKPAISYTTQPEVDTVEWSMRRIDSIIDPKHRRHVMQVIREAIAIECQKVESKKHKLRTALQDWMSLVGESKGIYGFHLNGAPSPWDSVEQVQQSEDALNEGE